MLKNYHIFPELKREAVHNRQKVPYIYEYYNVSCFTSAPDALVLDILARFVNCLIKALNDMSKLPRFIVVVPETDILQFVNFSQQGTRYVCREAISWIVAQMARAIDAKKDQLLRKKAGAVIANEPKIVWVKAVKNMNLDTQSIKQINKFNSMLEDVLAEPI